MILTLSLDPNHDVWVRATDPNPGPRNPASAATTDEGSFFVTHDPTSNFSLSLDPDL